MQEISKRYFLKDKKADIFKRVITTDSMGGRISRYVPISEKSLWCYAKQLRQDLYFTARAYQIEETRMFVFGFNPQIKVYDLVRYRGNWYEITRVDTDDDYNGDMFVYVKDCNTPNDSEIKEYGFTND